jgi:hypothetical protein
LASDALAVKGLVPRGHICPSKEADPLSRISQVRSSHSGVQKGRGGQPGYWPQGDTAVGRKRELFCLSYFFKCKCFFIYLIILIDEETLHEFMWTGKTELTSLSSVSYFRGENHSNPP